MGSMKQRTEEELNGLDPKQLVQIILYMQEENAKLNRNLESLIEQIRIANARQFGRRTEKLSQIDGQMSLFDEAEAASDPNAEEPAAEDIIITVKKAKRTKGQREEELKGLPSKEIYHRLKDEDLDTFYGKGCWRRLKKDDDYYRVEVTPAVYTAEHHFVEVAVGTRGDHQDEFMRADHPEPLLKRSLLTPSLIAAVMNGKYANAMPLYRIEKELESNGIKVTRQNMANWIIKCSDRYLKALAERLTAEMLKQPVNQSDETPVQVIHDNDPDNPDDTRRAAGHKNWMWVHRTGEFVKDKPVIIYEYQRGRNHENPLEFYRNYHGVLVTDGLEQYHKIAGILPGVQNANCWAHYLRSIVIQEDNRKAA